MLADMSRHPLALAALLPMMMMLLLSQSRWARADVKLPALVSDGMVLQSRAPVHVWGWASEGEAVRVTLRGQSVTVKAQGGWWAVTLKPLEPGGPFEMTIAGNNTLTVHDVLVGEVWVCSGQSNMEFPLQSSAGAQPDIDAPADPLLRMFTVGHELAEAPRVDVASGAWERATPEARGHFSAVGYYFGRALRAARRVPVGLIHASWGGTPAEAWMSREALRGWGMPSESLRHLAAQTAADRAAYERQLEAWKAAGSPEGDFDDPGMLGSAKAWALPATDIRTWRSMALPLGWERLGREMQVDGGVWFRKQVAIPPEWAGRELELQLGAIDDVDATYFNGALVGATGIDVPNYRRARRRYRVPASAARAGTAVIAVRVWDRGGEGGLLGPTSGMWLAPAGASAGERQSLAGDWRFNAERTRPAMPSASGLDSKLPGVLYNGMLAPLLPYTIRGVTWYQGESNERRAPEYHSLLTALIESWRSAWGLGDFPFLIVQLAPFMAIEPEPSESDWAIVREAQAQVARELPDAGVVVITDVGDEKDIHPTQKKPVGERLALAARRIAYRENVTASGPTFRSQTLAGDKLVLSFDHVGKGLDVRGERLTGFAIAGNDLRFVNAEASISGDRVVVSSPRVPAPAYVRFGWANYPVVNLWNKDGLPATPFRTDPH